VTTQIALLRAVNVGGHGKVAMADLRTLLERLGMHDVRSVLHAGSFVFSAQDAGGQLEDRLERAALDRLDLRTDAVVRSVDECGAVVDENPFATEAERDPSHLIVVFLKRAPAAGAFETLRGAVKGRETVHGSGRHLYVTYPDGIGDSRLTGTLIESKLGVRGTARNWNTVRKLHELGREAANRPAAS
jgi:uncharacterized protein (DUF1697 family)